MLGDKRIRLASRHDTYRSPYDWRYAGQAVIPSYDPYHTVHQEITGPIPVQPKKRSRGRIKVIGGAVAVAVVSGGIGAAVVAGQPDPSAVAQTAVAEGPSSRPAANQPAGSVEQVAAKVMPSVVKLQIDSGRSERRGFRHRSHLGRVDPDQQSRCRRRRCLAWIRKWWRRSSHRVLLRWPDRAVRGRGNRSVR